MRQWRIWTSGLRHLNWDRHYESRRKKAILRLPCFLQDMEKLAAKEGVVLQTVKEVLQSLVDDDMVHQDRIGASNYFWCGFSMLHIPPQLTGLMRIECTIKCICIHEHTLLREPGTFNAFYCRNCDANHKCAIFCVAFIQRAQTATYEAHTTPY